MLLYEQLVRLAVSQADMQIGGQGPNGQVASYLGGQADRQACREAGMQFNVHEARQLAVRTGRQADMWMGGLVAKRKGNYSVSKADRQIGG